MYLQFVENGKLKNIAKLLIRLQSILICNQFQKLLYNSYSLYIIFEKLIKICIVSQKIF